VKAKLLKLTWLYLHKRASASTSKGYSKQKWIIFCETMIENGLECSLYEARKTLSKYITVSLCGRSYTVRFSNHKPIKAREIEGHCDFFVGVTNTGVRTTADAIKAVFSFFHEEDKRRKFNENIS
jgi:hypothetical protein